MLKTASNVYDTIIIGAGIGGLVCGCCLAKAGMRVLIAERHHKPGGYCTSFNRQGFTFDAAAHSFGGYKYGNLGNIFDYLGVHDKIKIIQFDPSDVVVTPDYRVFFRADTDRTIEELQLVFQKEFRNIKKFFYFITEPSAMSFTRMRKWTFKNLLDQFFEDNKLKTILSFPLFGNGGLPPSHMSAFIGAKIFKEFILDGGYHPAGGMQLLSDALTERFKEFGGDLRLSSSVKKIIFKNGDVTGITLNNGEFIPARYVVSNCDARQTFSKLIGSNITGRNFLNSLKKMTPSLSMFALYLGVDNVKKLSDDIGGNTWYLSQYDLDVVYRSAKSGNFNDMGRYLVYHSTAQNTVSAFLNAPFKNAKYWECNKIKLADMFIKTIEKHTFPNLSRHILYKDVGTPHTFHRYTSNYRGAAYGWDSTPAQFACPDYRKPSFVRGLYLTGHWTTMGLGIPGVTYLGWDTANLLLKKHGVLKK